MRKTNNSLTRKQKLRVQAAALGDYGQSPDLDSMNSSIELLRSVIHELVQDIKQGKPVDPDSINSIYKLSNSLSGLSRARNETEKTRLETHQLYHLAGQELLTHMRNWLSEYPELDATVQTLIDRSVAEAELSGGYTP